MIKKKLLLLLLLIPFFFAKTQAQSLADCSKIYLDADTFYLFYPTDSIITGNLFYNDTVITFYPFIEIVVTDTTYIKSTDFMVLSFLDSGFVQAFDFDMHFVTPDFTNNTAVNAVFRIYDSDLPGDSIVTCYLPITIILQNMEVGIVENDLTPEYKIYPNPITNSAMLQFDNRAKNVYTFSIYNSKGQIVKNTTNITNDQIKINKSGLLCGMYFFNLQNDQGVSISGNFIVE